MNNADAGLRRVRLSQSLGLCHHVLRSHVLRWSRDEVAGEEEGSGKGLDQLPGRVRVWLSSSSGDPPGPAQTILLFSPVSLLRPRKSS